MFLENRGCVEGEYAPGSPTRNMTTVTPKSSNAYYIDWHKPEGAIAILQCEFRCTAQRCLANKRFRVRFDVQSHHIRSERRFLNAGAAGPTRVRRRLNRICVQQSCRAQFKSALIAISVGMVHFRSRRRSSLAGQGVGPSLGDRAPAEVAWQVLGGDAVEAIEPLLEASVIGVDVVDVQVRRLGSRLSRRGHSVEGNAGSGWRRRPNGFRRHRRRDDLRA